MDKTFEQQLADSLYVHFPLTHDENDSMEKKYKQKTVAQSVSLWDGKTLDRWHFDGEGTAEAKDGVLVMNSFSRGDHWPGCEVRSVDAENGAYATFGSYEAKLSVKGMELSHTNRLNFEIRPLCDGWHSPIVRPAFINNGTIKISDVYSREGFNAMNLKNFEWNTCLWEIGSIAHDKIEEVSFIMHRYGKELSGGEKLCFEIRNISLERVEDESVVHGWNCHDETAVYPTTGYFCDGKKTAVASTAADSFKLIDAESGETVLSGSIENIQNRLGSFGVMDFSSVCKKGKYYLQFGENKTDAFVKNSSLINTMMAGIEALGAKAFAETDPALAWKCRDAAREDFAWAMEKVDEPLYADEDWDGEHTDSMSVSQYYAAICLTASRLYNVTHDEKYAKTAAEYASKVVACQEDGSTKLPMRGFFYRDENKKHIIHSSHQSRDYLCVQAFAEACRAMPNSPQKAVWEGSMKLHGEYIKQLMQYNAPYGLMAAGMYQASEADDEETFRHIHPRVNFNEERENYLEQLSNGCDIGNGCYVRSMPVWFSFRGNSAILLAMGKTAALLGKYFDDNELLQAAREQLYWTLGKNPFGQSLIYGEGKNFGQMYTALLGETIGEMAVGVQTRANEDVPYWPQGSVATYREVWISPVSRWLWLAADLLG